MPATSVIKDGAGRVVAHIIDDRGEPWKYVSQAVDAKGLASFVELLSIPFTRDNMAKRPSLVQGQILITANVVDLTSVFSLLQVEVQVDGYVGQSPTTIARRMLSGDGSLMRVLFRESDTWDRIGISARQMANGVPSSDTSPQLLLQATGLLWR